MSRKKEIDFEKKIISQIKSEKIKIRPKWHFLILSILSFTSLMGIGMGLAFLINLTSFFLRKHNCLHSWRVEAVITSFPWWIPILGLIGLYFGIKLLKKYDFSYKKNFLLIVFAFLLSVLLMGILVDKIGLNERLSKGRMRRFYQRLEQENENYPGERPQRGMRKGKRIK